MFKRVDRRRKREEEEENLGLDEDEREVLGLNNTDSSESESDSDSSSSSPSAQALSGRSAHSKNKQKRRTSLGSHDKSDDDDDDSQLTSGDEVVDAEDIVADHLLSIASALKEPIQLIRTHPEAWVCVFCPNKILKHGAMVKVHEASQAQLSMDFSPDESIRTLLRSASEKRPKADGGTLSRRAEQRKAKQAKLKERRHRIKEKKAASIAVAKAKKATKEAAEVMPRPANTDERRPSKRLKANSGKATTRITSRPNASPQAEVRKRTKAAQRSKKQPQTNDGAMSA
ncbi:hypothetical protein BJY52DRAFT_1185404 [Lactarius psammicola]|nr:hypothetical protein BJY52DRAFT_1185404 [Lactarius psammicola]